MCLCGALYIGKEEKHTDIIVKDLANAYLGTLLLTFPLAAINEKAPLN